MEGNLNKQKLSFPAFSAPNNEVPIFFFFFCRHFPNIFKYHHKPFLLRAVLLDPKTWGANAKPSGWVICLFFVAVKNSLSKKSSSWEQPNIWNNFFFIESMPYSQQISLSWRQNTQLHNGGQQSSSSTPISHFLLVPPPENSLLAMISV